MMVTDLMKALEKYFNRYLVNDRGSSPITIETYRYAFIQFVEYLDSQKYIKPECIRVNDINVNNIEDFLLWLEKEKHVSISTRNQRLAAFKCFASFLKYERPEYIATATQIQGIVPKKHQMKEITYLKPEGMRLLMLQADRSTINGRRDYTMMCVLFLTGIRVSELISLRGRDISMENPRTLVVHGKGNKIRYIAIVKQLSDILEPYLNEHKSLLPCNLDKPVFRNHSGSKFTRQGINFMLSKYVRSAREINPKIVPEDCSPHKIRHSTAMALVEQGTDLIIIRDLLGHSSVQTTEIYAKVSTARRRAAIEASSKQLVDEERPLWEENTGLKEWLKGLTNKKLM